MSRQDICTCVWKAPEAFNANKHDLETKSNSKAIISDCSSQGNKLSKTATIIFGH